MAKRGFGMHAGGSSLLVIFVLLCLTTFATLSLVSSNADYTLTQKSTTSVLEYYAADSLAEEYQAEILGWLKNDTASQSSEAFFQRHAEELSALTNVQWEILSPEEAVIRYSLPVNTHQQLQVALMVRFLPTRELTPIEWKVVNIDSWTEIDDGPSLWSGEDSAIPLPHPGNAPA